jgi:site-specific DNA-cytosine methylase
MIPVEDTVPDSTTLIYDSKDKSHKPKLVGRDNTPGHDILKRIYSEDGKSPTITAHAGKGTVPKIETKPIQVGIATDIKGYDQIKRVYSEDGKSPTVTTCQGGHREPKVVVDEAYWRKLTPLECERLQTVPDNYTDHVSNSQRFKMLGNGWTVEVIKHIFKNMERDND